MKYTPKLSGLTAFLFFIIIFSKSANSQGWAKTFRAPVSQRGLSALPTKDGGYIFAISADKDPVFVFEDLKVIKTGSKGDTLWTKIFTDIDPDVGQLLYETSDGGYILVATKVVSGMGYIHLVKLNSSGTIVFQSTVASPWSTINLAGYWSKCIKETSDGSIVIAGELAYVGGGTSEAFLIKTNASGSMLWGSKFSIAWLRGNEANVVELTDDGGYLLGGNSESGAFIIKCDKDGYEVWQKNYVMFTLADLKKVVPGNGYIVLGENLDGGNIPTQMGTHLIRLNVNGDTTWTRRLAPYDSLFTNEVAVTENGDFCIVGRTNANLPEGSDILLLKTDNVGNPIWKKKYGSAFNDFAASIKPAPDKGFIIGGTIATDGNGNTAAYLLKTDSLGNVLTNEISGTVYEEQDLDCILDIGERRLFNANFWKIKLMPGDQMVIPDSNGRYSFQLDTGKYTVSLINNHPFLQTVCPSGSGAYDVHLAKAYDTISNRNFALNSAIKCALVTVSVINSILRPCREAFHRITYCNDGTADAINAFVEVYLDPKLTFTGSTETPLLNNNGYLKFALPVLKPGECGEIIIYTDVSCSAERNSVICVKAKASPANTCTTPDGQWDKSSMKVEGTCINNVKARFVITNTGKSGEGNMHGDSEYRVYIDNALVQTSSFRLTGGDSLVIEINPCGKTVRLEADQRPGHPGKSRPRATVEGCGMNDPYCINATYSTSMVTGVPLDNLDLFQNEECSPVRASFDPNEKLVTPAGISNNHYVSKNEQLEYRINFQNTGNDTAFKVVLVDTIDTKVLNISSFASVSASHPYKLTIKDGNIVQWVFDNILLPDSNENEKASHGYVKFKIKQVDDLVAGTKIDNKAAIYFDFNSPVITEPVKLIVKDTVLKDTGRYNIITNLINLSEANVDPLVVTAFPNPWQTVCIIKLETNGRNIRMPLLFRLFDSQGRIVKSFSVRDKQIRIDRGALSEGIYYYEIIEAGRRRAKGKLIIQ
jgi:uncharacterized repeat protein (TIGR01451 family)